MTATQLCTAMLLILRVLPVGGVLLAILILVLALTPPDGSRGPLSSPGVPARGALSDRDRQAETRQFLIHAALKRADQLSRLRDLPDTPTHSEEPQPQLAGLPAERSDVDPEESARPTRRRPSPFRSRSADLRSRCRFLRDTPLTVKRPSNSAQRDTRRRVQRPQRTTVSRPLNFLKFCSVNSRRRSASRRGRSLTPIQCSVRNRCSNINIRRLSAVSATGVEQRADRLSAIPATGVRQPADGLSAAATTGAQLSADRSAAATTTVRLCKPTGGSVHPHSLARYFPGTQSRCPTTAKASRSRAADRHSTTRSCRDRSMHAAFDPSRT